MPVCNTAPPYQQVGPGQLSLCWLTPDKKAPAVGADATGTIAEEAAAAMSVPQ
jgi:hypothetical protein